ncbi:voltage-gated potassium channel regulatory subunit KCNF1-like [Lampetra fluviatilis]
MSVCSRGSGRRRSSSSVKNINGAVDASDAGSDGGGGGGGGNPSAEPSECNEAFPRSAYRDVCLNIGGVRFSLDGDLLYRFADTRLAQLSRSTDADERRRLCDDFDPRANGSEFYFDRDPEVFRTIIDLFYDGEIHMNKGVCPLCFKGELEFWKIDAAFLDDCCKSSCVEKEEELDEIARRVQLILEDQGHAGESAATRVRKGLWMLMEKPYSSLLARLLAIVSFALVVISSVVLCLSTIPEMQTVDAAGRHVEHPTLNVIETVCIVWFTLEYLLRLLAAPHKLRFAVSFMNVIDVLAVMPYYIGMALTDLGEDANGLSNMQQAIQALRIMRIARIFKLARHSSGLQMLTYALKGSFRELNMLLFYLAVGIFLFSALGYTVEQYHPETLFTSIPHSFWWAIITMTTVGYGDIYPKTNLGKLNAAISFLCGILAIALPIHPIINNFVRYYNKQRVLDTAVKHQLDRMAMGDLLNFPDNMNAVGECGGGGGAAAGGGGGGSVRGKVVSKVHSSTPLLKPSQHQRSVNRNVC